MIPIMFSGFSCSPISSLITPEKKLKDALSPSKCGSTVKTLDFGSDSELDIDVIYEVNVCVYFINQMLFGFNKYIIYLWTYKYRTVICA